MQTLSGSLLLHYNTTTQKIQMKIRLVGIWIQTSSPLLDDVQKNSITLVYFKFLLDLDLVNINFKTVT